MSKVDLHILKAAMVLALDSSCQHTTAIWWDGVVKNTEGEQCVVLMVPAEDTYSKKALKVLRGYGITMIREIEGSSHNLLPIPVDYLENCLPTRVTRKWLGQEPEDESVSSRHLEWKKDVTAKLDELGIRYLKMTYSGSGDSANEDEWSCSRTGGDEWYPKGWDDKVQTHWRQNQSHEIPADLQHLISEYVWDTLVQYDCVNNDGGGGDLTIDLSGSEPEFLFSCYTNEMTSTDHSKNEEI